MGTTHTPTGQEAPMNGTTPAILVDRAVLIVGMNTDAPMHSSAVACLQDARSLLNIGRGEQAAVRALRALSYAVGVFDWEYQRMAHDLDALTGVKLS
jgi:hypothetical protein